MDKERRDNFNTAGLGTTVMNCYLQVLIIIRHLWTAEIGIILKREEDVATRIKTLSFVSSQSLAVDAVNDAWEEHKTCARFIKDSRPSSL